MNKEDLEKLTKEMREKIGDIQGIMGQANSVMSGMQPELMKDCEINGHKAKITLLKNGMINIVFNTPEQGKIFYEQW